MKKQHGSTKKCRHCKTEIDYYAKKCPQCRKSQGMGIIPKILIGVVAFAIIGAALNGGDDEAKVDDNSDSKVVETSTAAESEPVEEIIEYIPYEVSEMIADLDSNALKAEDKYQGQHIEVTGRLSVIDSSGKYISLMPTDEEYALIGVQCYLKDDVHKDKVMEMTTGDTITLKGKIKNIGEIMGYTLDIDEIK